MCFALLELLLCSTCPSSSFFVHIFYQGHNVFHGDLIGAESDNEENNGVISKGVKFPPMSSMATWSFYG
jgi:hypothetical protein